MTAASALLSMETVAKCNPRNPQIQLPQLKGIIHKVYTTVAVILEIKEQECNMQYLFCTVTRVKDFSCGL